MVKLIIQKSKMPLELKEALGDAFTDIDLTKGMIDIFS